MLSTYDTAPLLASLRTLPSILSSDDWQLIADQVRRVIRDYYVHLPLKASALAIDPVQEANLLVDDLSYIPEGMDREFFRRVIEIVRRLRDRHTTFKLPAPWANMVAFLPFTAESCWEHGQRKVIVTKVHSDVGEKLFSPGVEVTHWNGVSIARYIEALSFNNEGANPHARIALALRSLTVRSLGYVLPPDEDWVTISYLDRKRRAKAVTMPWKVYLPQKGALGTTLSGAADLTSATALAQGVDEQTAVVNDSWKNLFGGARARDVFDEFENLPQLFHDKLIAGVVSTAYGTFGYIRLFSFDFPDSEEFIDTFADLLRELPQSALILDVRSNPGGTIPSGEAILQLFTDEDVEVSPLNFRVTPEVGKIVQSSAWFTPWRYSFQFRYEIGNNFTQAFGLTDDRLLERQGRAFFGSLVVIVDALCYSTTDFFASGVQDNEIGILIGADPVTGGGGANVWTHSMLTRLAASAGALDLQPLPKGTDMNVAMRRSVRVNKSAGIPVEGLAVRVTEDDRYKYTRNDIMHKNEDLLNYAAYRASLLI